MYALTMLVLPGHEPTDCSAVEHSKAVYHYCEHMHLATRELQYECSDRFLEDCLAQSVHPMTEVECDAC